MIGENPLFAQIAIQCLWSEITHIESQCTLEIRYDRPIFHRYVCENIVEFLLLWWNVVRLLLAVCNHERSGLVSSFELKLRAIGASLKPLVIKKCPPVTRCGSIFVLLLSAAIVPIQDDVRGFVIFECRTGAESRYLVVVCLKLIRAESGTVFVFNNNQELIHRVDHQQI
ncbi:hypothetical protein WK72_16650 [Burkholderia ubonensis]|nr:hypothetical protein WK72_16650 [Burkholderia ubonensis]KWH22078.1 hypothetical protein WL97_07730 [Burkholderia ubonensis]